MKRLALLAGVPLLALAACAGEVLQSAAPPLAAANINLIVVADRPEPATPGPPLVSGPEDALTLPVTYACAGGSGFSAIFPADGRSVTVQVPGLTRTLDLVEGADAPFYRADGVQLAASGTSASLTGDGADYADCQAG